MRGKKECSQNLGPAHQKEGCQRMQSACRSWVEDEQQTYRQDNREEQLVLEFQLFPGSPLSRSVAGHRVCLFWTSVKGRSNPGGASAMSLPLSGIQTGRPEGTKNQDSGTQWLFLSLAAYQEVINRQSRRKIRFLQLPSSSFPLSCINNGYSQ
jgi:hypothetical protein